MHSSPIATLCQKRRCHFSSSWLMCQRSWKGLCLKGLSGWDGGCSYYYHHCSYNFLFPWIISSSSLLIFYVPTHSLTQHMTAHCAGVGSGSWQWGKWDSDLQYQSRKPLLHHQQQHREDPHQWRNPGQRKLQPQGRSTHEDYYHLSCWPWVMRVCLVWCQFTQVFIFHCVNLSDSWTPEASVSKLQKDLYDHQWEAVSDWTELFQPRSSSFILTMKLFTVANKLLWLWFVQCMTCLKMSLWRPL